jgi:hypothetical protein
VIACTGWTWDHIEAELDIPRLSALSSYWRVHPPMHVLLAGYVGFKPPEVTDGRANDPAEMAKLAALLSGR